MILTKAKFSWFARRKLRLFI